MASKLFAAFLAALFLLVASASSKGQQPDEDGWTSLSAGQTLHGIQYRQDRSVWIFNRRITTCSEVFERLFISSPSQTKRFVVIMCVADEGPDRPHIVNLGSGANYSIVSRGIGPEKALLNRWVSWSPNEDYALLASGGEGFQGPMVLANLKNGVVKTSTTSVWDGVGKPRFLIMDQFPG